MKILIVEDEEALYKVLEEKFAGEGFQVKIAVDGGSAVAAAEGFRPDIILLDLLLPKRHGLEVLKDLKFHPTLKDTPVIVLSNLEGDESIKEALKLGAVDYYVKTQHPLKEIVEKIKDYFVAPRR